MSVEGTGFLNQDLSQLRIDALIPCSIGIGQSIAREPLSESPYGKAFLIASKEKPQYRGSFPGKPTEQRPWRKIDPGRKRISLCNDHGIFRYSGQMIFGQIIHKLRKHRSVRGHVTIPFSNWQGMELLE